MPPAAEPPNDTTMRRHPLGTAALAAAAGVALGLVFAAAIHFLMREGEGAPFAQTATQQALFFGLWGAMLVPLWIALARIERIASAPRRLAIIVALGAVAWIVHASALYLGAFARSPASRTLSAFATGAVRMIYIETIVYAGVVGGILAARHRQRARAHERRAASLALQLSRSRLQALQARLQPHFLFNALHTVGMLARAGDTGRVVDVTARLGGLLRVMLDDDETWETTLREELELVDRYLAIELIRFHDRLDVVVDTDPAIADGLVPRFILQPLVENAMRHGIAHRTDRGRITIRARRAGDTLVVTITDDGPGPRSPESLPISTSGTAGLGLRITRERLTGMYGNAATLDLSAVGDGTMASVMVPWHTTPIEVLAQ
jgi:two-component system, LytTR family, sensor kinase